MNRGLGAGPCRELGGEMRRYINMFSAPARPVLDELFSAEPSTESLMLLFIASDI